MCNAPGTATADSHNCNLRQPYGWAAEADPDGGDALGRHKARSHTDAGSSRRSAQAGGETAAKAIVQRHCVFAKDAQLCACSRDTETSSWEGPWLTSSQSRPAPRTLLITHRGEESFEFLVKKGQR